MRLVAGVVLFSLPTVLFFVDARSGRGVAENGYVESTQVASLVLSALLLGAAAKRSALRRDGLATALLFIALGVGGMAIRELDGFFDKLLFHGAWKIVVLPIALGIVVLIARQRRRWIDSLAALLDTHVGMLLEIFVLTLLVFSRTFGIKALWETLFSQTTNLHLMADQVPYAARAAKNVAEEVTELFAYMELLTASFWALFERRINVTAKSSPPPSHL